MFPILEPHFELFISQAVDWNREKRKRLEKEFFDCGN